jgi:single-strand DNA-binding protein
VVVGNLLTESWDSDSGRRSANRIKAVAVGLNLARGWAEFKRPARAGAAPDLAPPEDAPPAEDPYADRSTDYIEGDGTLHETDSDVIGDREAVPALA